LKVYYVILSAGVPVDVTNIYNQAYIKLQEWGSRGRPAEIVECVPRQTEIDFVDDKVTETDLPRWGD
jgi:hypothetical protein